MFYLGLIAVAFLTVFAGPLIGMFAGAFVLLSLTG